jgi:hypothetical protein
MQAKEHWAGFGLRCAGSIIGLMGMLVALGVMSLF